MTWLKLLVLTVLVAPLFSGTATAAGCKFGKNGKLVFLKVLEPNATDASRSFTINGTALLAVADAKVPLAVSFSGADGCQERTAPTVACTVRGSGEVKATIKNPTGERVTYLWVCMDLD
jgi:hypothetical protein